MYGTRHNAGIQGKIEDVTYNTVENKQKDSGSVAYGAPSGSNNSSSDNKVSYERSLEIEWSCIKCSLLDIHPCMACNSRKPGGKSKALNAVVPSLALTNTGSKASKLRNVPKSSKVIEKTQLPDAWTCSSCTLLNNNQFLQCLACCNIRPS